MGLGLGIVPKLDSLKRKFIYPYYNKYYLFPKEYKHQLELASSMRNKRKISVLFVITSLASWKTEEVYKAMRLNERFMPYILLTTANDENSLSVLRQYMDRNNYPYFEIEKGTSLYSKIIPDIIFYQKPYDGDLSNKLLRYDKCKKSVLCYVPYGINNSISPFNLLEDNHMQNICFQMYFENQDVAKEIGELKTNYGVNHIVTGHPGCDNYLLFDKSKVKDPWKEQNVQKKRIIYAPHHSIDTVNEWLPYSTFLEFGEFMLKIAEKYKDEVQFAFKPHPVLIKKLYKIWGKERTDSYYSKWNELENCQLETGEYTNLFMFSDAMIHDCGSFQIEYHYTHNPVMYLTHDEHGHRDGLTHFAQKAFDLHYKGHCKTDIEQFIQNVIKGVDPLKEKRMEYYKNYLLPPNGKTATENIIDAILGEGNYK